ncbi:membrane integrity-associated transporter subunit PqiC [Cellvibrio sp.]|uniref:PqiC family protein n=1 Tax=Cellvibrio sp. TaxID=1965322 RepID=UPI0039647466
MRRFLFVSGLCLLLCACQHSPKKNYFYLSPLNEKAATQSASNQTSQLIGIGPVDIAEYLMRSQIIESQSDNTLTLADNAYWAEPLDKSIARVISLNLTQLNPSRSFVHFPWRNDSKPRYSLRIHIDQLSRTGRNANINATWELVDNDGKSGTLRRNFLRSIQADSGTKGLAQAYSQLLGELSKEMDDALNKAP